MSNILSETQNGIYKCVTTPIAIPHPNVIRKHDNTQTIEYGLKRNFFDPNKCSPPNSWNTRLMLRLDGFRGQKLTHSNY